MAKKHVAECYGVKVPDSSFLSLQRIERINAARYEGQEIAGALSIVQKGDRVLELGAGLGLVGAIVAKNAAPERVLSFEANANLIEPIRSLYALNRLGKKISVRNEILLAEPDAPKEIPFYLKKSYLGSSLVDSDRRTTTRVEVATASYAALHEEFAPDILLIDIEGGELQFLRHANLEGVRGLVIEFHPEAYGRDGMRECKSILTRAGFSRIAKHTTRYVWTCVRGDTRSPPVPGQGWSTRIKTLSDATIVPPAAKGLVQSAGILDSNGSYRADGAMWRHGRELTTVPARPDGVFSKRSGTWLWGGTLWMHFGHFLVESLSRLWALDRLDTPIDGILSMPKRPRKGGEIAPFHSEFFEILGVGQAVCCVSAPERVERLILPGQGLGLGQMMVGTDQFRAFARDRFCRNPPSAGPEKIYISRSRLPERLGSFVGEKELEDNLRAEGYTIYYPEAHSIAHQIATYRAARKVVAAEGSALHLLAFCASENTDVAVVVRRPSGATRSIATHLTAFTGASPTLIFKLKRVWKPIGPTKPRSWKGELDLPRVKRALVNSGFISSAGPPWKQLDSKLVQKNMLERFEVVAA